MPFLVSRRSSFGLAICACAAPAAFAAAAEPPPGYTAVTHRPEPGRAPRMQAKVVAGGRDGVPRTWALMFHDGDDVLSGLSDWMTREHVRGAHLSGIGAFAAVLFGWYDSKIGAYKNIPVDQQVECASLNGDVGLMDGKPALHVHAASVREDGTMTGGHVLKAVASPTLEVFATETDLPLTKAKDPATGLTLFDL